MIEKIKTFKNVGDIFIVDNGSDYQPLLEWYETMPCNIIRIENIGHTAPWQCGLVSKLGIPYVVTDPDLGLDDVPIDVLDVMLAKLKSNPKLKKIGLGLEWEKVGENSPYYNHMQTYEIPRWKNSKIIDDVYINVPVDTTFAMYNFPRYFIGGGSLSSPYKARHYPWEFTTAERESDTEFSNYIKSASSASSYKVFLGLDMENQPKSLTDIANRNKTDKGTVHFEAHGYTEVYGKFISDSLELNLFEIGVWHGDSIRMWNEYNENINLYAIDIDPEVKNYLIGNEKVSLYIGDQSDATLINEIFDSANNFDFVIDDGSHNYSDILASFKLIYPRLKHGAVYFIEDLHAGHAKKDMLMLDLFNFIRNENIQVSNTEFFCDGKLLVFTK
jgi:hypothetical protein